MAVDRNVNITPRGLRNASVTSHGAMTARIDISGRGGGTDDYRGLSNKPSINGVELFGNKTNAELHIPTDTNELTNGAGFIDSTVNNLINYYLKTETYTKEEVEGLISAIQQCSFEVVESLPLVGETNIIYLVLKQSAETRNIYDEYIYVNHGWEKIGDTQIDLSNYVTTQDLSTALQNYVTTTAFETTLLNYYDKDTVDSKLSEKANVNDLATVATSGNYNDLSNKPTLGTAASKNVPVSGNAANNEVVIGNDTRLSNSRPANDVYNWAKQPNKPNYNYSEIQDTPSLGTAAAKNIPTTGDASTSQVVMGNDSRLSDARPASDVYSWAKQLSKPTYNASEVGAIPTTDKGANGGVAELDNTGKLVSSQLPLGESSSTAYRGDRGKTAYDHASDSNKISSVVQNGLYKVGVSAEGHISDVTPVQKSDITGLGVPAQDTTYESKQPVEGGTDVSLVTTGEKDTWNKKSNFSGNYNDLSNKPFIPTELADLNEDNTHQTVTLADKTAWNGKSDFSGSYNDLTDKPTIPAAQIQSDWNQTDNTSKDYIKNKPDVTSIFTGTQAEWDQLTSEQKSLYEIINITDDYDAPYEEPEIWGFIDHMNILDPTQRIEYIKTNKNYTPLTIDDNTHTANYGSWAGNPILEANVPAMIKSDGTLDYYLDPDDYTKKLDGTPSDVANTAYQGGAFAYIPKVYSYTFIRGNDRYVMFSMTKVNNNYKAVGFMDHLGNEYDGMWIPMFYGISMLENNVWKIKSIGSGTYAPSGVGNLASMKDRILSGMPSAKFFGGPIINIINELLTLFSKNSKLDYYGYGNSRAVNGALNNAPIGGGQFYGTQDGSSLNKVFHSLYPITCQANAVDPYTLLLYGRLYVSPGYYFDLSGQSEYVVDTGIDYSYVNWRFPKKAINIPDFGWMPDPEDTMDASDATAYGDFFRTPENPSTIEIRVANRFGNRTVQKLDGPRAINLRDYGPGNYGETYNAAPMVFGALSQNTQGGA